MLKGSFSITSVLNPALMMLTKFNGKICFLGQMFYSHFFFNIGCLIFCLPINWRWCLIYSLPWLCSVQVFSPDHRYIFIVDSLVILWSCSSPLLYMKYVWCSRYICPHHLTFTSCLYRKMRMFPVHKAIYHKMLPSQNNLAHVGGLLVSWVTLAKKPEWLHKYIIKQ